MIVRADTCAAWVILVLALLLQGCLGELPYPQQFTCDGDSPECPPGLVCLGGVCRPPRGADLAVPDRDLGADAAPDLARQDTRPPAKCGNKKIEPGEECDGENLGGKTCKDLCYSGGSLACKACSYAVESCDPPTQLVKIPAKGLSFHAGSANNEIGRYHNETRHKVTLSRDFYILPTEVTQEQFEAAMGYNPSWDKVKGHPVEEVTWSEAASFCNVLSDKAGLDRCYVFDKIRCPWNMSTCPTSGVAGMACKESKCRAMKVAPKYRTTVKTIYDCPGYRLPTEVEWEMAYRAGTTTATYAGDLTAPGGKDPVAEKIAWYYENTQGGAALHRGVALKRPNQRCVFDMAGNVWEYASDFYQELLGAAPVIDPVGPGDGYRTLRGGAHGMPPRDLRAARRLLITAYATNVNVGFRYVRTAIP